jgi:hypothetical protein
MKLRFGENSTSEEMRFPLSLRSCTAQLMRAQFGKPSASENMVFLLIQVPGESIRKRMFD